MPNGGRRTEAFPVSILSGKGATEWVTALLYADGLTSAPESLGVMNEGRIERSSRFEMTELVLPPEHAYIGGRNSSL